MKLGMLATVAAFSLASVTGASAQVYVADPYAEAYVGPPAYSAPGPVIVGEPVYMAPAPVGGYVPPKYSYTINSPRYGVISSVYQEPRTCAVDADGYRYCY